MRLTRRDALRAVVATTVGAATAPVAYGAAYERHRIVRVDQDVPVSGLPPSLDGLRVGLITDIHHSNTVSAKDVSRAVTLLADAKPDLIVLGGDYVTYGNRAFVEPVAELLAPLASAPHGVVRRPRQSRRRPRHAGGADAARLHRAEGSAHDGHDPQRSRRHRRHPLLDAAHAARDAGAERHGTDDAAPGARSEAAAAGRASWMCRWCCPGTRTAARSCCRASAPSPRASFPCSPVRRAQINTSLFVSRGVGTVYIPVRINCPPEVAVLTLRTTLRL